MQDVLAWLHRVWQGPVVNNWYISSIPLKSCTIYIYPQLLLWKGTEADVSYDFHGIGIFLLDFFNNRKVFVCICVCVDIARVCFVLFFLDERK